MTDLRLNDPARADDPDVPDVPVPPGPEPQEPDENKALTSPINELESRLLRQRKVLVFGAIDDKLARDVTGRLLALAAAPKPIDVYVNSPGGHVESGDTIHDMIRFVDAVAPVRVIGTGWVASAGALIFLAGAKERRFCLPNTRFLLHQPMGGVIARETGQPLEKVERDTDRNYWMSAEEAIAYGMVNRIITDLKAL
jgi:ATP-dependent Clp protease protease subunit